VVHWHTLPRGVHVAEVALRRYQALFRSELVPSVGLSIVARHAFPAVVHDAEVEFSVRFVSSGCAIKPSERLLEIPWHSAAVEVEDSELRLSQGIALLG